MAKVGSVCVLFFSIVALGVCDQYQSYQQGVKNSRIYVLKVRM